MTAAPRTDHDPRCPSWKSDDPDVCTCRDAQGFTPVSWADGPLCAFDIESTSADPTVARLVTATVVRIRPGAAPVVTSWLSDVGGEPIPDEAAQIHGVTTERARTEGKPIGDVVDQVAAALRFAFDAGTPVVGHNISYDFTVMAAECARLGLPDFVVTGHVVDSIVLDRGVNRRYKKGAHTLTAACTEYGVVLDAAHTSDADAIASARVAWKIARRYPVIGTMPLAALQKWQADQHRAFADDLGAYFTRVGRVDNVERDWPMRGAS